MNQAQRYRELAARTEGKKLDSSYHAAFYLLSCEQGIFDMAKKHVNAMGIGFDGLKRSMRGFDETSLQVVEIAYNLFKWTGKCKVTPFDISRMGYPYMEQVCNAIWITSGEVNVQMALQRMGRRSCFWTASRISGHSGCMTGWSRCTQRCWKNRPKIRGW